jgi:AcrR family transcriptional regulator
MRAPAGQGKQRLLHALFDEFGAGGPSPNLSIRYIAERLDVHHTSLTYHFGSRAGLLAAILAEARARDNAAIAAIDPEIGFAPLCRAVWRRYSSAEHNDRARAFFHVVGLAVYEGEAFPDLGAATDGLTRILEAAALRDGYAPTDAKQQSLIAIAGLRGLLLQRLIDPDADVAAAAERFIATLAPASVSRGLRV